MTISIKPTASGSTIEQDGSSILSIDASGNLTVPNNLSVTGTAPIPDALSTASGSAPSYSARAWVNFNGTGTVAIRDSGNVSSITDNGVGYYQVNFTTAMPDTNYSVTVTACLGNFTATPHIHESAYNTERAPTTSNFVIRIYTWNDAYSYQDQSHINAHIFS